MIIPAILSDSLEEIQQQLDLSVSAHFKRVQIDIIDPEFANNVTISPIDLLEVNLHNLQIDMHLMTNEPINDVVECSQIPGISTIIAQVEHMDSQQDFTQHIQSYKLGVGFSLDLYTPVEAIEHPSFEAAKIIQVMGNKAGEQGKEFAGESVLAKISELVEMKRDLGYSYTIAVDIGMNPTTIQQCIEAGAEEFSVGSFLWKHASFEQAVQQVQASL